MKFNKKSFTLATWMVAFLFIVFVMLAYLFFVLVNYSGQTFFGRNTELIVEESASSFDHRLFLLFLNKDIGETTILGGIKHFIDPFFEIKNDKGESFIALFGIGALERVGSELRNDMYAKGFDDGDWQAFIAAQKIVSESELIRSIVETLNKECDRYLLKIPFGTITEGGLKNIDASVFEDSESKRLLYTPTIQYTTYYRGEVIEIKFRKSIDCT
ncbi:MAG: hypothetical protein RL557_535 [archaeon]|jgi:hypothetical protein